jgi:hypothetical protein
MASTSEPTTQEHSTPDRGRATIEWWRDNGAYHATEPDGEREIVGRGETAALAVAHYAQAIEDMAPLEGDDAA